MLTGHVLPKLTNMSHVIHKVAFGPEFPGQVNPLDGFNRVAREGEALRAYKYFLKVWGVACCCSVCVFCCCCSRARVGSFF